MISSAASQSSSSSDPMAQFLQLASTASSPAILRSMVHRALSHPRIHAGFAELKEACTGKSPNADLIHTLDLFSYGTYRDYRHPPITVTTDTDTDTDTDTEPYYMDLNEAQLQKLKRLTVVTIVRDAMTSTSSSGNPVASTKQRPGVVPYATFRDALEIEGDEKETLSGVEEMLMACVYSHWIHGKLDQRTMQFVVMPSVEDLDGGLTVSRDVILPRDLDRMISTLQAFSNHSKQVLQNLETVSLQSKQGRREDVIFWNQVQAKVDKAKTRAAESSSSAWGASNSLQTIDLSSGSSGDLGSAGFHHNPLRTGRQTKRSRGWIGGERSY
uniref:PCI domain-containing protein n=1 Tax=Attheya septentrionalis TaxID=420275 RepID=A0A7S2ULA8_9STRA|mmetsp:Transcript_27789/g.50495  ORF Transcript_27789/g.50495 Transcript_27789/m.50495 type:complete len:328 (+) Transcript_27789:230-1213(+)